MAEQTDTGGRPSGEVIGRRPTAMDSLRSGLWGEALAEFLGTFVLISFGDGVVAMAVAALNQSGRAATGHTIFLAAGDWLLITWGWVDDLLVSTADDYLAFARMMLGHGEGPDGNARILARPTVTLMMTDQITSEQKAASPFFPGFWDNKGWGLGAAVTIRLVVLLYIIGGATVRSLYETLST